MIAAETSEPQAMTAASSMSSPVRGSGRSDSGPAGEDASDGGNAEPDDDDHGGGEPQGQRSAPQPTVRVVTVNVSQPSSRQVAADAASLIAASRRTWISWLFDPTSDARHQTIAAEMAPTAPIATQGTRRAAGPSTSAR